MGHWPPCFKELCHDTILKLILLDGVVQIMTDAALLKRQKKEIEELRNKLQVS